MTHRTKHHRTKHLRKLNLHSLEHNHHHSKLKHLVAHALEEEKRYWPMIVGLFGIVAGLLLWGYKADFFSAQKLYPVAPAVFTQGYKQGILSSQNLNNGLQNQWTGQDSPQEQPQSFQGLANSLVTSTNLSKTGGATPIKTQLLQKSLIATFYLGETTNVLQSSLENDLKLLQEIENVLSVDLFQYLNQSTERSDSLQNHLILLNTLEKRAQDRQSELSNTINFLDQKIGPQEELLKAKEQSFFTQMDQAIKPSEENAFLTQGSQGNSLEGDLKDFVKLQQQQVEDKAKRGAYESLRSYYQYYGPILKQRIAAIEANREALIAGVRVVDLPGIETLGGPEDQGLIVEQ